MWVRALGTQFLSPQQGRACVGGAQRQRLRFLSPWQLLKRLLPAGRLFPSVSCCPGGHTHPPPWGPLEIPGESSQNTLGIPGRTQSDPKVTFLEHLATSRTNG